jgi:hypothetical protein
MSDSQENLYFLKNTRIKRQIKIHLPINQFIIPHPTIILNQIVTLTKMTILLIWLLFSALTNIKNCLRRGSFTKTSLVNFKQRNPSLIKVLLTDGGDVTEVNYWLFLLSDKIANLDEVSQSSCLNILLNIKITYPFFLFPDEVKTQWFSYNFHSDEEKTVPPKVTDEKPMKLIKSVIYKSLLLQLSKI